MKAWAGRRLRRLRVLRQAPQKLQKDAIGSSEAHDVAAVPFGKCDVRRVGDRGVFPVWAVTSGVHDRCDPRRPAAVVFERMIGLLSTGDHPCPLRQFPSHASIGQGTTFSLPLSDSILSFLCRPMPRLRREAALSTAKGRARKLHVPIYSADCVERGNR